MFQGSTEMIAVYNERVHSPELSPLDHEGGAVSESEAKSSPPMTVVFTTGEGTLTALRAAAGLADKQLTSRSN
jgi:hypothetical protein